MRRVVSLFLPMWSTDRYRKNTGDAPPRDKPLVMATKIGSRRVIVAADKAAQALGLRLRLTVAHAQALVPELHVAEATPAADDEGLTRLATWCMCYSPLVAVDRRFVPTLKLRNHFTSPTDTIFDVPHSEWARSSSASAPSL